MGSERSSARQPSPHVLLYSLPHFVLLPLEGTDLRPHAIDVLQGAVWLEPLPLELGNLVKKPLPLPCHVASDHVRSLLDVLLELLEDGLGAVTSRGRGLERREPALGLVVPAVRPASAVS